MNTNELFINATRNKYRYPYKGLISTEDLWNLSVSELDGIFKSLNKEIKKCEEESLLSAKSAADTMISNQIEIIKYIVSEKLAEKAAREKAAENKEKKQKILSIMATRQDEKLMNASDEELQKMLSELE